MAVVPGGMVACTVHAFDRGLTRFRSVAQCAATSALGERLARDELFDDAVLPQEIEFGGRQ